MNYPIRYSELNKLNLEQLISTVCMISPFSVEEKQKLIETIKIEDKSFNVIFFFWSDMMYHKTLN